jgi:outer membrane protein TolC
MSFRNTKERYSRFFLFIVVLLHFPAPLLWGDDAIPPPQPLSLSEAIERALGNNFDLEIAQEGERRSGFDLRIEEAFFDPALESTLSLSRQADALFMPGDSDVFDTEHPTGQRFNVGLSRRLLEGGRYTFGLRRDRFHSGETLLNTDLFLTFTQPLLRGAGREITRLPIAVAKTGRAVSHAQLKEEQSKTILEVTRIYWQWVGAHARIEIAQRKRASAEQLLAQNRARVEVGVAAPIEIEVAETAIAAREEALIVAQAEIDETFDRLALLLRLPRTPMIPADAAMATPPDDWQMEEAPRIESALTRRPEIIRQRLDIHRLQLATETAKNQTLPLFDFTLTTSRDGIGRSDSDAIGRLASDNFYQWEAGLALNYPIGNRKAEAQVQKSTSDWKIAHLSFKQLERQVVFDVRDAIRRVKTDWKRVETTARARALAERQMTSDKERFSLGLANSRELLDRQDDLSEAEENERRALIDYHQSHAQLDFATGTGYAPAKAGQSGE